MVNHLKPPIFMVSICLIHDFSCRNHQSCHWKSPLCGARTWSARNPRRNCRDHHRAVRCGRGLGRSGDWDDEGEMAQLPVWVNSLVGGDWNHGIFMTFHILEISSSQLTSILFRGVETTNQLILCPKSTKLLFDLKPGVSEIAPCDKSMMSSSLVWCQS